MQILFSFLIIIMLGLGSIFGFYNGMVSTSENCDAKWHQVENQMQRRADLIPNLVETVKGYANHEEAVFKAVTDAREQLLQAKNIKDMQTAEGNLNNALGRLLAISENYPNLKANQNFIQLHDELAGTENRIAVAKQDYNNSVQVYNTKIKSLPYSMFAGTFGFSEKEYFNIEEGKKEVPKVNFGK